MITVIMPTSGGDWRLLNPPAGVVRLAADHSRACGSCGARQLASLDPEASPAEPWLVIPIHVPL